MRRTKTRTAAADAVTVNPAALRSDSAHSVHATSISRWTARERELLAATLRLLQRDGYDRLSLDAVATEAKASKATMYRRWPSKRDLVLAAFTEGIQVGMVAPNTGSLRGDLLAIGTLLCDQLGEHASTMTAVFSELSRSPALTAILQDEFIHQRRLLITEVLTEAVDRGEIDAEVIRDETWDVMPGYLFFRCLIPGRAPTDKTVVALVDDVILPSLTRTRTRTRNRGSRRR
jgi:AcrR family transcriptional regulator